MIEISLKTGEYHSPSIEVLSLSGLENILSASVSNIEDWEEDEDNF